MKTLTIILPDDITVEASELNGHNVMFRRQPSAVLGCPMGRGRTVEAALCDLKRRVEIESPVEVEFIGDMSA